MHAAVGIAHHVILLLFDFDQQILAGFSTKCILFAQQIKQENAV
jgi:hypothetical protein